MEQVDLEMAKRLAALGYDELECTQWVVHDVYGAKIEDVYDKNEYLPEVKFYPAPRLDDVLYWLQQKHGIFTHIEMVMGRNKFTYELIDMNVSPVDDGLHNPDGRIPTRDSYPVIEGIEITMKQAIVEALNIISQYQ